MTHGTYTPLQELPNYSDEIPLHPQSTVELEARNQQRTTVVHDVTQRKITACCLICSILNYLCCPCLGIPALIFAILGTEAEKRGELEAAKSHAFHNKIFNILYAVVCPLCTIFQVVLCIIIIYYCILIANAFSPNNNNIYYSYYQNN